MATAAEVVGAPLPVDAAEDSESILDAMLGELVHGPIRNSLVFQAGQRGHFAVRDGPWKLILLDDPTTATVEAGQLYNLAVDLGETNNLYDQQPQVVASLTGTVHQYQLSGASARRLVAVPAAGASKGG